MAIDMTLYHESYLIAQQPLVLISKHLGCVTAVPP
jgi:hypothetical protein